MSKIDYENFEDISILEGLINKLTPSSFTKLMQMAGAFDKDEFAFKFKYTEDLYEMVQTYQDTYNVPVMVDNTFNKDEDLIYRAKHIVWSNDAKGNIITCFYEFKNMHAVTYDDAFDFTPLIHELSCDSDVFDKFVYFIHSENIDLTEKEYEYIAERTCRKVTITLYVDKDMNKEELENEVMTKLIMKSDKIKDVEALTDADFYC